MFRFVHFTIDDEEATMKVGTDAVLLGALTAPDSMPDRILDIGTGCGILALMLAQRFAKATVDALDIDMTTTEVARRNFTASPWSERLTAHACSLQHYEPTTLYDLIVCNPPYFTNALRNNDPRRRAARHDDNLPHDALCHCAARLLTTQGTLAVILPSVAISHFAATAHLYGLYVSTLTHISNRTTDSPIRSVLQLQAVEASETVHPGQLSLRNADNTYSQAYYELTKDFLLWSNRELSEVVE